MTDTPLVIRVAANLSEMRTNLAEGVSQLETYKSALTKASNSFDGSRIVAQASAAAKAIENAGGVTSLTASEAQRASQMFSQAAEKMQLMGQGGTYQAGVFRDLAAATAGVKQPTEALGQSWVARIAEGMLLRDAIHGVIDSLKEIAIGVPEEAKQLQLLSLQTQINVEDLQVLKAATREYGVDSDQLGKALYQLGRRIAGGDDSVATAYHLMGMSLEDVKNLDPVSLFLATERGLGKLQGAIRDTAAADLFGGKLGLSLGAFSTNVDEAMQKARELNTIASTESVNAAAAYADAIDRAKNSVHAWFIEIEGGAAQGFNTLNDAAASGIPWWKAWGAALIDGATKYVPGMSIQTNLLTSLLDEQNKQLAKNAAGTGAMGEAHRQATVAVSDQTKALQFMLSLEKDSAKPILDWQAAYLAHLDEIGKLTAKNAAAIGVNADQFDRYKKSVEDAKRLEKEHAEQAERVADAYAHIAMAQGRFADVLAGFDPALVKEVQTWIALGASVRDVAAILDLPPQKIQIIAEALAHQNDALDAADAAWKKLEATQRAACDNMAAAAAASAKQQVDLMKIAAAAIQDTLDKIKMTRVTTTYDDLDTASGFAKFLQDNPGAYINPGLTSDYFKNHSLQDAINAGLIDLNYWFETHPLGGLNNPYTTLVGGLLPPSHHFASGTMSAPGGMALVGERGPEIVNLPRGSQVIPNSQLGGLNVSVVVQGHVYGTGGVRELAKQVGDEFMRQLRTSGTRFAVTRAA